MVVYPKRFDAQFKEDGEYWRKEMPSGEKYLFTFEVLSDENDIPVQILDNVIRQIA